MCLAQSSREARHDAPVPLLSTANRSFPPVAAQEPKIGNAKMSFTVTTTISINTSAIPVR